MELASLLSAALAGGFFTHLEEAHEQRHRDEKVSVTEGGKSHGMPGGGRPGVVEEEQTAKVSGAPTCPF